jgi:hypothetical protein
MQLTTLTKLEEQSISPPLLAFRINAPMACYEMMVMSIEKAIKSHYYDEFDQSSLIYKICTVTARANY